MRTEEDRTTRMGQRRGWAWLIRTIAFGAVLALLAGGTAQASGGQWGGPKRDTTAAR